MVSFHQWRKSLVKTPKPRQITFVCGEETVLIDDVIAHIRGYLEPEPWNDVRLSAGDISEREIWAEVEQHPLGDSMRVVVIRHANKIQDWERFTRWVKDRTSNPRTHLVLVSDEERVPKTEPTEKGQKPEVVPWLKDLGTKAHIIECRPFTTTTSRNAIPWIQGKVRIGEHLIKHLMERTDFNLRLVRDVLVKLAVYDGTPTIAVINQLLTERPRDSFTDALLAMDRPTALLALRDIEPSEYGLLIGQLDSRLDLVGMIYDMQSEYHSRGDIMRAAGKQAWLVPDYIPIAKHYDQKRRRAIRKVLSTVDEAYRGGQTTSIMEALVLLW